MTYREQLNKVRDLGVSICDLEIANELDAVLDFEYTDWSTKKARLLRKSLKWINGISSTKQVIGYKNRRRKYHEKYLFINY